MLRLKSNSIIRTCSVGKHVLNKLSTSVQTIKEHNGETKSQYETQLKQFETLKNITRKVRKKKPQRPPFIKSIMVGKFDAEILIFPQLEKYELEELENLCKPLRKLIKQPHMLNVTSLGNKNFRQNLADYRAIGLQASEFINGYEFNVSESSQCLEIFAEHPIGESIICNEQLSVQTLLKYGSEPLKTKYLHELLSGEKLAAYCLTEPSLSDVSGLITEAKLSSDKDSWIINGEKAWVVNGLSADYLVVFAITDVILRDVFKQYRLSAFVVDKNFGGIKCKKRHVDNLEVADISFNNTPVPSENLIGELNCGDTIIKSILEGFRLSCGTLSTTLTKNVLNNSIHDIIQQSTEKCNLKDADLIKSKLGELSINLYVMESITYLTTGLLDWYEDQDCNIESAIVKVLTTNLAHSSATMCLEIFGAPAVEPDHWIQKLMKKSVNYITLFETNDNLKMYIALAGLEYAGKTMAETIKQYRNPLYFFGAGYKRLWTRRRQRNDDPKLDLGLNEYLHPSLASASQNLEYCVKRLEFVSECILLKHGPDVLNKHMDLRRLADIMIDVYALTAVLGRASRAYCIGLQNAEMEIRTAIAYTIIVKQRVQKTAVDLLEIESFTNDHHFRVITEKCLTSKKYFAKHPLTRNF